MAGAFPGFDEVDYRDWPALLGRLARDAASAGWRGPLVIDELPYLVQASPELPSRLQRWLDHEAKDACLAVALAGSSQRMMQGLVLHGDAPLHGRARELFEVRPLPPRFLRDGLGLADPRRRVEAWAAWGGVPRYWELASAHSSTESALVHLVLDPAGPLHTEPERLLMEESPPALELRSILDAIGMGAHRVSEIAGRIGAPATSLSRPLKRLQDLGLVAREVPFGEPPQRSRSSLYRLADPFLRLWFRIVAPQRAQLLVASPAARLALLRRGWSSHVASVWEDLCRALLPSHLPDGLAVGPASRWWWGTAPEWDLVAADPSSGVLVLGEAKWTEHPVSRDVLATMLEALARRPPPVLSLPWSGFRPLRVLMVPDLGPRTPRPRDRVLLRTASDLL